MTSLLDGTNPDPMIDPNKDYFTELTKEGGKFYDADPKVAAQKVARGKVEADAYIETMKRMNDELRSDVLRLREDNMSKESLKTYLDQLKAQSSISNPPPANDNVDKPVIKPEDVDSLVSSKIEAFELKRKEEANYNRVKAQLEE